MAKPDVSATRRLPDGYPDTFFGVVKKGSRGGINDPLEFYDYCLEIYKQTAKDRLLELLGAKGIEKFEKMSQLELAKHYSEGLAISVFARAAQAGGTQKSA